jgi:uncharacterized membrane protein
MSIIYLIFLIIVITELWIDFHSAETRNCIRDKEKERYAIIGMLIFHHLIASFMTYGWMLPNKLLLVLFMVSCSMMLLEWYTYKKCRFTVYVNHKCGHHEREKFRDLFWKLGLKRVQPVLTVCFLLFGLIHLWFT